MSHTPNILAAFTRYRHGKGFGVHSPSAFYFITSVLGEKLPFYCFSELAQKRKRLKSSGAKVISEKHCKMLFRIVNFHQPDSVLELGAKYNISTLYLAAPSKLTPIHCYTNRASAASESNIHYHLSFTESIANFGTITSASRRMIVIHNIDDNDYDAALLFLTSLFSTDSIIVLFNISKNSHMSNLWNSICSARPSGETFYNDSIGIIFLSSSLPRIDITVSI